MNAPLKLQKKATLFPVSGPKAPLDEDLISRIADKMVGWSIVGPGLIPAGYTYLGQMIAHDIVPNTNLRDSRDVQPFLNLESVYGTKKYRKEKKIIDEDGKFLLGSAVNCPARQENDMYRDNDGNAIIPEIRNDENIIISQLHVLWQRLHNKIIDDFLNEYPGDACFKLARTLVILLYQRVIIDDFLRQLLPEHIYNIYCVDKKHFLYENVSEFTHIPLEFSHAAFRFGHTMIQPRYKLNSNPSIAIEDLFLSGRRLDADMLIDWTKFFRVNGSVKNHSNLIDLRVAGGMRQAPFGHLVKNIVRLNLSASQHLPTGENIVSWMKKNKNELYSKLRLSEYPSGMLSLVGSDLDEFKETLLPNKFPLWLFLLHESHRAPDILGSKLGYIGGCIVAEVMMMSIRQARPSTLQTPEKISHQLGHRLTRFYKRLTNYNKPVLMADIIHYINN